MQQIGYVGYRFSQPVCNHARDIGNENTLAAANGRSSRSRHAKYRAGPTRALQGKVKRDKRFWCHRLRLPEPAMPQLTRCRWWNPPARSTV